MGKGGHGGFSPMGKGGVGNTTSNNAEDGLRGGGGAGGRGQDNASGEGGASGHYYTGILTVSAGQTVTWLIGNRGARGDQTVVYPGVLDRFGGWGGYGVVRFVWLAF